MSAQAYPRDHVFGLILAGGQGRRLGSTDKAFVQLAGAPLIQYVARQLSRQTQSTIISANGAVGRFASYDMPVVSDQITDAGPLAGVLAAMDFAALNLIGTSAPDKNWLLSAPVDCPFLPSDLGERLYSVLETGQQLALAQSANRQHFLCGLWNLALRKPLRAFLGNPGNRRAEAFVSATGFAVYDWPTKLVDPFININTPEDIAMAEELVLPVNKNDQSIHTR